MSGGSCTAGAHVGGGIWSWNLSVLGVELLPSELCVLSPEFWVWWSGRVSHSMSWLDCRSWSIDHQICWSYFYRAESAPVAGSAWDNHHSDLTTGGLSLAESPTNLMDDGSHLMTRTVIWTIYGSQSREPSLTRLPSGHNIDKAQADLPVTLSCRTLPLPVSPLPGTSQLTRLCSSQSTGEIVNKTVPPLSPSPPSPPGSWEAGRGEWWQWGTLSDSQHGGSLLGISEAWTYREKVLLNIKRFKIH